MNRTLIIIQTLLLSTVANALSSINCAPDSFDVSPSSLAGEGTGTCIKSQMTAGDGTGTCIMNRSSTPTEDISKVTASDIILLEMIRNRMNSKSQSERALILERLEKFYDETNLEN
jgi:hypothetical protein